MRNNQHSQLSHQGKKLRGTNVKFIKAEKSVSDIFQDDHDPDQEVLHTSGVSLSKIESLQQFLGKILSSRRISSAILPLLYDLKDLLNIHSVTIFIFDSKMSDLNSKDACFMQQMLFDGHWIDRIGVSSREVTDPCFKKGEELFIKQRI